MEQGIEIARQLVIGLFERMGIEAEVEGALKEDILFLEITGNQKGILIGRHGCTLDSLQILINRMLHKQMGEPLRVVLDVNHYLRKRVDNLTHMAARLGERAKRTNRPLTIGPFNAHDRRIIHMALKEDPSLSTESLGEGETKRVRFVPGGKEGERVGSLNRGE